MEEKYLGTKNKIFYRKNKFSNKRKTLIFVHGVSGSSSAWINFEKRFSKIFNILTFDLRGHGKSFRPEKFSEYYLENFSEDLYGLIKHENVTNPILIGHSFGNLVILNFLEKHLKLVKSVIFVSTEYAPSKRLANKIVAASFLLNPLAALLNSKKKLGHVDYSNYKNTGDWNLKRMYADAKNTGFKSYLYSLQHSYNSNAEKLLPKIKIPVLIIHGDKDTIFDVSYAKEMASKIKNSKIVIFRGANHIIPLNYFKKLSKEIEKFVKKY